MKTWHIWDFPDTVYFSFNDNFRNEFFGDLFKKFGGIRPAARFFGISQMAIKQYAQGYSKKNGVKHPQSIPIAFLKKSMKLLNEDINERVESNVLLIKAKNRGNCIHNPKLPFQESPAFYRIVAHMIGDGSAPGNKVPYYANTCRELINQFREDLKIFGELRSYDGKLTVPIISFPKVITDILAGILNVRFSNPGRIPKLMFSASDECKSAFLQALFDDEGTISTVLALGMSNQNLVSEIRQLVENLSIMTNNIVRKGNRTWKDNFTFSIRTFSYSDFREKIGFSHPQKIKNLDSAIQTRNRTQRTRDMDELKLQILKMLELSPLKTLDIANNVQLTLGHTLRYLKELEKENKLVRSGFSNQIIWRIMA